MSTTKEYAAQYIALGLKLCAIRVGGKRPKGLDWGANPINPNDLLEGEGVGLIHAASRTCAIDFDNLSAAKSYFLAHGIDIDALLNAPDAVQISSGRVNRAKLLYRLPANIKPLVTHSKLKFVEFRCASSDGGSNVQDVLPPSIHPETTRPYEWHGAGNSRNIPVLPASLLAHWQELSNNINDSSSTNSAATLSMLDMPITPEQLTDLKSALAAIPADDYSTWIKVGLALKSQGVHGWDLWNDWSANNGGDYALELCEKTWDDFAPNTISYRSVFAIATEAGWTNPKLGAAKLANLAAHSAVLDFNQVIATPSIDATGDVGTTVDFTDMDEPDPELVFYVDKWIPQGQVTLLAGHGGSGKSFFALSLAVHVALGIAFGDRPVTQAITYFFSAEDNGLQMRKRVKAICRNLKYADGVQVHPAHLTDKLIIQDVTNISPVLYMRGVVPTLAHVSNQVRRIGAELVIIDNASDTFDGDEIKRNEVKGFIQALRMHLAGSGGTKAEVESRGAVSYAGAVMLLTHINKGAANGTSAEDYSGSTAWHNSVRSRLSLVPAKEKGAFEIQHLKSNYSTLADSLTMQWVDGAFRPFSAVEVVMATLERKADALEGYKPLILEAFQIAEVEDIRLTANASSPTPLLKVLSGLVEMPKELTRSVLKACMDSLVLCGDVRVAEVKGANRALVCVYQLVKKVEGDYSDLL